MQTLKFKRSAFLGALALGLLSLSGAPASADTPQRETATFAAGCFWSMEAIFKQLKGVLKVAPGYSGGSLLNPTYEQVETGTTGHAETLDITFDPKVISYNTLLKVLLTVRDPTTKNRQGPDEGPQYRSVIFYHDDAQKRAATEAIAQATRLWPNPIVTEVVPFRRFWRAEAYHFNYYRLHTQEPYCKNVIAPEIADFRAKFRSLLK
ncbi:MAG: peptide-methionine (S)-S-oxide reductase MsrA [Armatimonas sp.]